MRPGSPVPARLPGWLLVAWLLLPLWISQAATPPPPPPDRHVADRAGALLPATRAQLDAQLTRFERETSSQVVVWIERKLPADVALEPYVNEVFRSWKIGLARTNNGILLAVFLDDRRLRIEVGRGLEGVLPDITAGRIIANEITPQLRAGRLDAGIQAGVTAILAATRGEYRGTGRTVGDGTNAGSEGPTILIPLAVFGLFALFTLFQTFRRFRSPRIHRPGGMWTVSSGGWSSGGGSGWSSGGGDSGGFSGGGGDSGGGGASGSW
jgi:uncharacterized protein